MRLMLLKKFSSIKRCHFLIKAVFIWEQVKNMSYFKKVGNRFFPILDIEF